MIHLKVMLGLSQKTKVHLQMYWVTASELPSSGENAEESVGLHGLGHYLTINAAPEHGPKCQDLLMVVENTHKLRSQVQFLNEMPMS